MDNYDLQDFRCDATSISMREKKYSELPQIKRLKIPKQIIPEILRENKWADFLN